MKLKVLMMQNPDEVFRDMVRLPEQWRIDTKGRPIPEGFICKLQSGTKSVLVAVRGTLITTPTIQSTRRRERRFPQSLGKNRIFAFAGFG